MDREREAIWFPRSRACARSCGQPDSGGVLINGPKVIPFQIGIVENDLILTLTGSEPTEHIPHGDPRISDAGLAGPLPGSIVMRLSSTIFTFMVTPAKLHVTTTQAPMTPLDRLPRWQLPSASTVRPSGALALILLAPIAAFLGLSRCHRIQRAAVRLYAEERLA